MAARCRVIIDNDFSGDPDDLFPLRAPQRVDTQLEDVVAKPARATVAA